ncbi:MAG: DUF6452 family protein [Salinivirgaceae bacterium]|nr:DUF6452 family protein [Salinivirgaceae bacterium]
MNKILIQVLSSLVITLGLFSCNQADTVCPDTQVYDFKLILERVNDSTSTRLKIYYTATDSIITESNFPELVNIPVDLNSDSMSFYIDFINDTAPELNKTDTFSLAYKTTTYMTDQECGFIMKFEIDTTTWHYTTHQIDTTLTINHLINADNEGNLAIFY